MVAKLTRKSYWEENWKGMELPIVKVPLPDVQCALDQYLPREKLSLFEIGCAPGGWMEFFHRRFNYSVGGIEYVESAASLTRKNMDILRIQADVVCDDFFSLDPRLKRFDVVFSGGFIEHFEDAYAVCQRIADMASSHVVTIVPNLYGLNGWISQTIRPHVFRKHVRIDRERLRELHEKTGLTTVFCDYVGGLQVISVTAKTAFSAKHRRAAAMIDYAVNVFNDASRIMSGATGISPRWRNVCPSLLYIGRHA